MPEADESLVGFLIRLAEQNHIDNPLWLARLVGIPFATVDTAATTQFDLGLLSAASGVDPPSLERITYWRSTQEGHVRFLDHRLGREMVTLQHRRACPSCLLQAPYHRAVWDISVMTVCPDHAVRLIDRCPACRRRLGWSHGSILICRCGMDLRRAAAEKVPPAELAGVSHAHRMLGRPVRAESDGNVGEPLASLGADETLSLLLHFGWFATGARLRPRPIKLSSTRADLHRLLDTGYRTCLAWPSNFDKYLDALSEGAAGRPGRYGLAKQFGPFIDWAWDPDGRDSLRTLLHDAVRMYLARRTFIHSRSGKVDHRGDTLTLREAAHRLRRSIVRVHKVLERHGIIIVRDGRGRGAPIVVEMAAVSALRRDLDDLVGRDGARRLLGCPKDIAAVVLDEGFLRPVEGPAAELFGRTSWRRSDLVALLDRLERCADAATPAAHPIPLPRALRILESRGRKIKKELQAVIDGQFGPMAIEAGAVGLARILVDATICQKVLGWSSLSIPETARELRLKEQVVYGLCNAGIIRTIREPHRRGRRITADEIWRFRETYVTASQLGLRRGCYCGRSADHLMERDITPVSGPTVDGGRQYLFRRCDVAALESSDLAADTPAEVVANCPPGVPDRLLNYGTHREPGEMGRARTASGDGGVARAFAHRS
ncbi:TniQ family protein [Inquilinus sp. CAU 1745]|uniref:TniQ family protein n=1 Tax=Inquilinus sp. CAU 1745 TaxID=3140369 RepID=UPI00325A4455